MACFALDIVLCFFTHSDGTICFEGCGLAFATGLLIALLLRRLCFFAGTTCRPVLLSLRGLLLCSSALSPDLYWLVFSKICMGLTS